MKINFGYCCISVLNKDLRCNNASTKTYLDRHNSEQCRKYLTEKADINLNNLYRLLEKNQGNKITAFRIPEQLFPQLDLNYYSLSDYKTKLKHIGRLANSYNMQLSSHLSHYFVLNSKREDVVEKTITSLNFFGDIFGYMELEKVPNLTVHVGVKSVYEDTEKACDAFCLNFEKLNNSAKNILVIENDQNSFTADDCLSIHNKIGIPVVFDNRHFHWNKGNLSFDEGVKECVSSWGKRTPKLHLSSDCDRKIHAHSDFIDLKDYFELEKALLKYEIGECNIMLECKQKDAALLKLRKDIEEYIT